MKKQILSAPQPLLQRVIPRNIEGEKEKFFFDQNYNPQFEYDNPASPEELERYSKADDDHFTQAKGIIDTVIHKFDTESNFLLTTDGKLLSQDEVKTMIQDYLEKNALEERVTVQFLPNRIARTAVEKVGTNFLLKIRIPFDYREAGFQGTLNHEIGTHIFRWLNEFQQPWYQNRERFKLGEYLETEEGIASFHAVFTSENPFLWTYALYYYLVNRASVLSFAELNKEIRKYVDDRDRRWKFCLRVKRGIRDTSVPGTFSKDQVYFSGIIKVLTWLRAHDYDLSQIYWGKISVEDLARMKTFANTQSILLPEFYKDKKSYSKRIEEIAHYNNLK